MAPEHLAASEQLAHKTALEAARKAPTIDQLDAEQAVREATIRAQLRDLAEQHVDAADIVHVSRRRDDGRLWILCRDGEIVYVAAEVVDAYLERHKPRPATLRRQRRVLASDMAARGKLECSVALTRPARTARSITRQAAGRESHSTRPGHRRSSSSSSTSSADPGDPDSEGPEADGARLRAFLVRLITFDWPEALIDHPTRSQSTSSAR